MVRALRIPLLLLVSVALSLLLCEGLVRLLVPQQLIVERPDVWRPVAGVGWRKRPHVATTINTGEGEVSLRTDERGYRVGVPPGEPPEGAEPREAGEPRAAAEPGGADPEIGVLVLGDSFMEALQVEYAESLAGRIESGLERATGRRVRAYDTGVSGWGPSQYLIEARRALADLPVDAVVVALYLGNDFEAERVEAFPPRRFVETHSLRCPRSFEAREWVDAVLYPINDALERSSHLFVLAKNANQALLMRLGLTARYLPLELTPAPAVAAAWEGTAATVDAIVGLAAEHDVPALVVLLPSHYQVVPEALDLYRGAFDLAPGELDVERPNRRLAAALRARGVPFVDALPALARAHADGRRVFGRIDTHLSAGGHAVVYEAIEDRLLGALAARHDLSEHGEPTRAPDGP